MFQKYLFVPWQSLNPTKLVNYNEVLVKNNETETLESLKSLSKKRKSLNKPSIEVENFKKVRTSIVLSEHAIKNMRKKISWLYHLSKPKYIKTYTGKEIFNFKINFITLKLPAKQLKPTIDTTNDLLNVFLTEVRQRTNMKNYVWRLEFQKNGNVHYHIVSDTYLDYFFLLKIWNRVLDCNGYIDKYRERHSKMSLIDYNQINNADGKVEFKIIQQRYFKGVKENWSNPNSVDVKSVISKKAIAYYITKYFSKNNSGKIITNELDNDTNIQNLRLWFCSRSLSRLDAIRNIIDSVDYNLFEHMKGLKEVKIVYHRYCSVLYYTLSDLKGEIRKLIEMLLKDYSKEQNYTPDFGIT